MKINPTSAAQSVAMALALMLTSLPVSAGDPDAGQRVFRKCATCHEVSTTRNKVGPHLVGIFGRTAGVVENFRYSDPMKNSGIVWDEESIAAYSKDPKGFIPGNRMVFAGLKSDQEVADLIAYLRQATAQ